MGYTAASYVELKSQANDLASTLISFDEPPTTAADVRLLDAVRLLQPIAVDHTRLTRVGGEGDGGYVMLTGGPSFGGGLHRGRSRRLVGFRGRRPRNPGAHVRPHRATVARRRAWGDIPSTGHRPNRRGPAQDAVLDHGARRGLPGVAGPSEDGRRGGRVVLVGRMSARSARRVRPDRHGTARLGSSPRRGLGIRGPHRPSAPRRRAPARSTSTRTTTHESSASAPTGSPRRSRSRGSIVAT